MTEEHDAYVESAIRWAMRELDAIDYTHRCYAFVEDAYELGNDMILDGKSTCAAEAAEAYRAGDYKNDPPQRGAYVFYDCWGTIGGDCRNWGHVGIHMGDGAVIHAWDRVRVDNLHDVENLKPGPGFEAPRYVGWTPVSVILRGMTDPTGGR
ncbi:MAG: hypothetical protein R6U70_02955 [Bacillota bacterium]